MPPEVVDVNNLARRVAQLEKRLDGIAERATRREEDWGTVRSKAARVDQLREEIRELRRLVNRAGGSSAAAAPAQPVMPVAGTGDGSIQGNADAALQQLRGQ